MARPGWLSPLFTFTVWPVTIVALLTLIATLFSTIYFFEELPHVPKANKQHGLDVETAYRDLQLITASPHPYNSHRNDLVRSHILTRVSAIARRYPHVTVDVSSPNNATWAKGTTAVYFEGNNVLVRVAGTSSMTAVLFSAHFDSVSTAPGATDDGVGVVTLLQLVEHFAVNRPKRDVVFNINNGEEDGLNGAQVFLEHPWSHNLSSFLNLEGAGAGGRPILFRSSTAAVAKAFWSAPHPHANVLAEDAFSHGLVRSATDFSVYTSAGIAGLDFAFYRKRALYHTREDSIPWLAGGKKALWNMLESTYFVGRTLADDENIDDSPGTGRAVYFDLFGEALVVTSLETFFIINVVLLVVGPILTSILIFLAVRRHKLYWSRKGWLRFPLAVIVSLATTVGLATLVNFVNPYIFYSSPYLTLAMELSAAYISLFIPLRVLAHFRPIFRQKTVVLFETYWLSWLLLVLDTILISISNIGGLYFLSFLHAGVLLSFLIGLAEHFELPPSLRSRLTKHIWRGPQGEERAEVVHEPTETTPLIGNQDESEIRDLELDEENQFVLWMLQFLAAAPFNIILALQLNLLAMASLQHTLADGNPSFSAYLIVAVLSWITVLPLAPFTHKFHSALLVLVILIFVISTTFNLLSFPFSSSSPLKIRFYQTVDLDSRVSVVHLSGIQKYLDRRIIPELPSSFGSRISCGDNEPLSGLRTCSWEGIAPSVAQGLSPEWVQVNATAGGPGSARLAIKGIDTRYCKVYFDNPITNIHVIGSSGVLDAPLSTDGFRQVELWSRSWDRTFEVEFEWKGEKHIEGKVSCGWDETRNGRIPALDEIVAFSPSWSGVVKAQSGLVEVTRGFSI